MLDDAAVVTYFCGRQRAALCPRHHHAAGNNRYLVLARLAAGNRDAGRTGVWIGRSRARPPAFEQMAQRWHKAREQVSAAAIEFVQAMPVVNGLIAAAPVLCAINAPLKSG